ncbi:MAG: redox-sensing transcriptional repressor Rex [Bacillota bacterium]|nr:redox-sensing transcriptional repressor Rex [Bacillota bacterium]
MNNKISKAVINRMPKYYRYLGYLKEKGVERVSSKELGEMLDSTASQVRQDFNNFGGFGQQGYGYKVSELLIEIERILGLGIEYNTVIIGAGNIGQAMAKHQSFKNSGFHLMALFDKNPELIGSTFGEAEVLDESELEDFLQNNKIDIAFICVGEKSAQRIAETLEKGGVRGLFNFALVDLKVGKSVAVKNVHLVEDLFLLSYYLNGEAR